MKSNTCYLEESIYRLFEISPIPVVLSHPDGKFEYVNPALCQMLGYDRELIYSDEVIITHLDDLQTNQTIRAQLKQDPHSSVQIDKRYQHKLGHTVYAQLNIVAQLDQGGKVKRYISQLVDLGSIKKIDASEILLNHLIDNSSDAIYVVDVTSGAFLNCNHLAHRRLGYHKDELLTMSVSDINPDVKGKKDWQLLRERLRKQGKALVESRHQRKDGTIFHVESSITYIKYNGFEYNLAIVRDISRRKQQERETIEQLNLDPLTNLPNRRLLDEKLAELIPKAQKKSCLTAFMYIDLDNFKQINDQYGHTIGDGVLKQTANRLKHCTRKADIITRLGGDEFLVVMSNLATAEVIKTMAEKIQAEFNDPFNIQQQLLSVEASVGVAVYEEGQQNAHSLIQLADEAMYQAKKKTGTSIYYI